MSVDEAFGYLMARVATTREQKALLVLDAEIKQLRAQANCGEGHDPERICCAHAKEVKEMRAELERLRARDEEIDAVVQAWRELRGVQDAIRTGRGLRLGRALDRLTDAHGRVVLFRALDEASSTSVLQAAPELGEQP